jgi:alpha-D-ribose 1-methylphosphonate 5-triphosphate synthase subunit PhnH
MDAMARPGSVQRIASSAGTPAAMMRGTAAMALTLFDHDTPIWLDSRMAATPDVGKWLKFHTSAPVVTDPSISSFALVGDPKNLPALDRFAFGSNEYPDRSTTLILQVASLSTGDRLLLEGPGIDGTAAIAPAPLPRHFVEQWKQNRARFPRGVDLVLAAPEGIACLPRTTRIRNVEG